MNSTEQHVDYPHHPGTLYDCPACGLDDEQPSPPHGEEQPMIDYAERDVDDYDRYLDDLETQSDRDAWYDQDR